MRTATAPSPEHRQHPAAPRPTRGPSLWPPPPVTRTEAPQTPPLQGQRGRGRGGTVHAPARETQDEKRVIRLQSSSLSPREYVSHNYRTEEAIFASRCSQLFIFSIFRLPGSEMEIFPHLSSTLKLQLLLRNQMLNTKGKAYKTAQLI